MPLKMLKIISKGYDFKFPTYLLVKDSHLLVKDSHLPPCEGFPPPSLWRDSHLPPCEGFPPACEGFPPTSLWRIPTCLWRIPTPLWRIPTYLLVKDPHLLVKDSQLPPCEGFPPGFPPGNLLEDAMISLIWRGHDFPSDYGTRITSCKLLSQVTSKGISMARRNTPFHSSRCSTSASSACNYSLEFDFSSQ